MQKGVTDQKMHNPSRSSALIESVTTDKGKYPYRLIKITKTIADHFGQHCRNCEHCQQEMKKALAKAEQEAEI